ncbi:MAG TPA: hypothetical protein PLD88_14815, partial [Candidatus Berkiella sp.]|nr:hypothetical protein [Candidatus Berkiella sp.]
KVYQYYNEGYGTVKQQSKTQEYLKSALAQNDPEAMIYLGNAYLKGEKGIEMNPKKGCEWLQKAADNKIKESYYPLGTCYKNGLGSEQNYA